MIKTQADVYAMFDVASTLPSYSHLGSLLLSAKHAYLYTLMLYVSLSVTLVQKGVKMALLSSIL